MSVGNLIEPVRDKSSLGNTIVTSVGQSTYQGNIVCKETVSEIMEYPRRKFSVSLRKGTVAAQDLIFARSSLQT